jgi:hypothetical protein
VFKDRFSRGSGSFSSVVDRLPPTPLIAEMGPAAPHTPKELADYKLYVVNKLVEQSANPDPKLSYPAIKSLGEIDGVDAFKRRSEVTVQVKPIDEVEKDLLARLEKLERLTQNAKSEEVIDVEAIDADSREDTEA